MEYVTEYIYNLKMPPRKLKVVDVINPEGYACDDNVLPEAIADIDPSDEQTTQTSHFSDNEEVAQVTQVTQPVSNTKTVEQAERLDGNKKKDNTHHDV